MNSATAQMVSDALDIIAPEPEIITDLCIATDGPMGLDHYDCDPVTCDEAAWMRSAGMTDDVYCDACGGECTYDGDDDYDDRDDEPCDCSLATFKTHRIGDSGCDDNLSPITFIGA